MSPLFRRSPEANVGSTMVRPVEAAQNLAPTTQPADGLIPVAQTDLRQLQAYQKALERYVQEAIDARASTTLTADLFGMAMQVTSEFFIGNLLASLRQVENALRNKKPLVRFLNDQSGLDPPEISLEKLEKDVAEMRYLLSRLEGRELSVEEKREHGDRARVAAGDVERLLNWIAESCKQKSAEVLDAIEALVDGLLQGTRAESASGPQRNEAAVRDIGGSDRITSSRQSDRSVITSSRLDRQ